MKRISAAVRISLGLACLTMSVLLSAQAIGLMPDETRAMLKGQRDLCETVAIQTSLAVQKGDEEGVRAAMRAIAFRNPEILSASVRKADGTFVVQVGEAAREAREDHGDVSTATHVHVPIFSGDQRWGTVEIIFRGSTYSRLMGALANPMVRLTVFMVSAGFFAYLIYLRKTLQMLDPTAVIPERVKAMLDTLAEGVLVLDSQLRIVLANESFARTFGRSTLELQGLKVSRLPWEKASGEESLEVAPWQAAIEHGDSQTGVPMNLRTCTGMVKSFTVNCAPILGGDGSRRGALATFADVTAIEEKNSRLREMVQMLEQSREEINRQNKELQALATTDPLTGCLNRRSFFAEFQTHWSAAKRYNHPLSCLMVDVDHFKRINDRFGHGVGDQVLQQMAQVLKSMARETDVVCRYGGEEFCVLLPHTDLEHARQAAERLRKAIESRQCLSISITASVGVSALELQPKSLQDLLDQADKALYVAKRSGRNRVVSYHDVPADLVVDESKISRTEPPRDTEAGVPISFQAVTALMSALAHRDKATADHSHRVADLCVAAASGLMSATECFVLECAALLHDIGKLGVPDAILLKPGELTEEEWKIMQTHDRMGVEIISAAFGSAEMSEIVRIHHAWFGGSPRDPELPLGKDIPLRARILSIADAYDAMVSDRPYRKARTREEAFEELRRFAGRQFDPELVEHFIQAVITRDANRQLAPPPSPDQQGLRLRLETERLACAVDTNDMPMVSALAARLVATARQDGAQRVAQIASELQRMLEIQPQIDQLTAMTRQLLELCHSSHTISEGQTRAGPAGVAA